MPYKRLFFMIFSVKLTIFYRRELTFCLAAMCAASLYFAVFAEFHLVDILPEEHLVAWANLVGNLD